MCLMFGGPSAQEEMGAGRETKLAQTFAADAAQQYAQQQDVLKNLNSIIQRIQTGQTGYGFGDEQNALLRSQIKANAAANFRNASQQAANAAAGQRFSGVGDTSGLRSGIARQIGAEIATGAGESEAQQLNAETLANINQGRTNAITTAEALQRLQGDYNPLGYGGAASSANQSAFGMESQIQKEKIARAQAIAGLAERGLMTAATFGVGGLAGGGGMGGGFGGFMKAGLNALGGNFQAPQPSMDFSSAYNAPNRIGQTYDVSGGAFGEGAGPLGQGGGFGSVNDYMPVSLA